MSNTTKDPMTLNDEEVAEDSFLFYNPSTKDYTSFPTDIPDLLSASAQVYADDMDTDLVWPEDHENVALAEPSASAIEQARPQIDSWLSNVNASKRQQVESLKLSTGVQKQLAFLQTRPSRGPRWIRKAATINRKTLASYERTRPDLSLSEVEKVNNLFWNHRAQVASWFLRAHNVPQSLGQDTTVATAELDDSLSAMDLAGLPMVNTMITAIDLNQGTLEDIQQQEQSEPVSQRQLSEVRHASHGIRQMYDDLRSGEKGPEFQELLGTWIGSLRDLQEAGVTELPAPPE
ncbi:hypothetical protein B9479_005518 [Cryptococcus floricola]|uniref:Uncharacterized protein n=1 Tax=Cryptococcus floricola TaxID=2591691 RepID=A0A5D3ASM7_9TREE|nr:hypothetical protein B9479_005518 [Cryptococcus floricola]